METVSLNVFLTSNIMLLLMMLALRVEVRRLRKLVDRFDSDAPPTCPATTCDE